MAKQAEKRRKSKKKRKQRQAKRSARELSRIAYHEAGHAVAAIKLGLRLEDVSVVPEGTSAGHATIPLPEDCHPDDACVDPETRYTVDSHALSLLTAHAAEYKHTGKKNWGTSQSDVVDFNELAWRLHDSSQTKVVQTYFKYTWARAMVFVKVSRNWVLIEAIANALQQDSTLSGDQARKIVLDTQMR